MSKQEARGYETRDVRAWVVLVTAAALVAILVISHLALNALLASWTRETAPVEELPPLTGVQERPALPRLQINPARDLQRLREAEEEKLNSYEWVDREAGIARIPIERAMDIMVKQGLQPEPQPEQEKP